MGIFRKKSKEENLINDKNKKGNLVDKELIDKLSIEMKEILEKELKAGNEIVETSQCRFSNDSVDNIYIFLKYPFKTKIRNNLEGITYIEINDKHYWKAEYTDEKNHQTLACNF